MLHGGARFRSLPGEPSEGDRSETIATGDGMRNKFDVTLAYMPVTPGTVSVTDGLETFTDHDNGDGTGLLKGSSGGSGTVNYASDLLSVSFMMAPAMGAPIVVEYVGGV
ncbi:MAG: hypothetical protein K9J06_02615 [Flavobacteriales bacterium]|nr:hypothetical protein [Flavobacteriales bacterium]